jgi:hypothetical protein
MTDTIILKTNLKEMMCKNINRIKLLGCDAVQTDRSYKRLVTNKTQAELCVFASRRVLTFGTEGGSNIFLRTFCTILPKCFIVTAVTKSYRNCMQFCVQVLPLVLLLFQSIVCWK